MTAASPVPSPVALRLDRGRALLWGATITVSVAVLVVSSVLSATLYAVPVIFALLLSLALAGAIVAALVRPAAAAALSAAAVILLALLGTPDTGSPWPVPVTAMIAFSATLAVASAGSAWRTAATVWLIAVAATSIVGSTAAHAPATVGAVTADLVVFAAISAAAVLGGLLVARWQDVRRQLLREQRVSASEQALREVAEERTRIARELHDVVAHGMSAIQVQASSARYRLPDLTPEAAAEFDELAATARSAMGEMRMLLGVLRREDVAAETAPQPGLADVPALVTAASRRGAVRLDDRLATGFAGTLDPVLSLAVYRIVQESLSNIARHATGAVADVLLERTTAGLVVEVANERAPGRPASAPAPESGGHGIRGMRERAELLGGSLEAGPRADGGFRVRALLPLDTPDSVGHGADMLRGVDARADAATGETA
ncbi:sensor histidine kinase [Leifsonia aquatica]|uniref:sensor histidine kinase n=1 Tax=Leifsonia aquatica TaxID=144185 RepID=UPI000469F9A0|nr:sensor histidine kinase [Leifsonia aquatica]